MPLLLLAGCGAEPAVGTMVLAVGDVPEDVQTISVFVREVDSAALVATATLTVPTRRVSLGVPAEVPLELNAVARSEQPASEALGGRMPVYVARTVRTVPLGNEQYVAALDARPGGGLTVVLDGDPEAGVSSRCGWWARQIPGRSPRTPLAAASTWCAPWWPAAGGSRATTTGGASRGARGCGWRRGSRPGLG